MTRAIRDTIPRRTAVVGTSGSGKTTLARRLAQRLGVPHIELDAIHWGPDWTPTPQELFRARTIEALSGKAWTTDGNYSAVRSIVWSRADTIVWLDYALPVIMARVTWRTFRRVATREELWQGNREQAWAAVFSRDSIIRWALHTYRRRREEYPILLAQPEHAHLNVVHVSHPHEAEAWLESISLTSTPEKDQVIGNHHEQDPYQSYSGTG